MKFKSGSIGTIHYFVNGNKSYPKERIEIFGDNKIIKIDNFKKLKTWGIKHRRSLNSFNINKGQSECVIEYVNAIKNGFQSPISFSEIVEIHEIILESQSKFI